MNFFARQEAARRKTRVLLAYYVLAVFFIVCAFYLASRTIAFVAFGALASDVQTAGDADRFGTFRVFALDPLWMLLTAGVSLAVIACGTLYRRVSLAGGGASVALSAGGREILPATRELNERRLLNIVEEIALASGVPVPRVFVLEGESGINAFAAGFSLRDAAVAVTRGAMERLERDELQGVIAHEFSHILNGDMRLNSWLIGVLFGILVTSVAGRGLMMIVRHVRFSGNNKKGGGGGIVLLVFLSGLALWVIGSVGVFFARIIQSSVSRQREFLADASAVQFTRNPMGLAGALKRIGASHFGDALRCANRAELSHLLFASASASGFHGMFASHPPLVQRIRNLDSSFNGDFSPWARRAPPANRGQPGAPAGPASASGDVAPVVAAVAEKAAPLAFLMRFAPELRETVTQPAGAASALYALLLSEDSGIRQRQLERVTVLEGAPMAASAERWRELLRHEDRAARRMFAELAVEGARHRDPESRAVCVGLVRELVEADDAISLFEYMLQGRVVRGFTACAGADASRKPLPPGHVKAEVAVVLGMLSYAGHPQDDAAAGAAWQAGVRRASSFGVGGMQPARESCTLAALDRALTRLNGLIPLLKGELITACSAVVRADGALTPDETELIRAVADRLDMPLPPL
ncbi:MAG: M48 family metallopeptidase [Kiritimatiellae bacterium]|nr:M48 family metallopeptidase [Kiritimatiellia bacterium]